eukprot:2565453-Prymnesium_polylepis.1
MKPGEASGSLKFQKMTRSGSSAEAMRSVSEAFQRSAMPDAVTGPAKTATSSISPSNPLEVGQVVYTSAAW